MTVEDEVSLRPLALRPGGNVANPFASFGKGLGYGVKGKKAAASSSAEDKPPKKNGERVRYAKDFLLKFMEKYNNCPSELEQLNLEIVVTGEDRQAQQEVLQARDVKVAEEIDDRDWRARTAVSNYREPYEEREFREPKQQREPREPVESRQQRPAPTRQDAAQQQPTQLAPPAPAAQQPVAGDNATSTAGNGQDTSRIAKASDVGRQAYRPGGVLSTEERAVRSVKGILNKLTPEKFERLLNQLLEVITTADILQKTIALVFENAVEQPTYVAMYGDLCVSLSKELPQFPPPPGSDKPLSFRQILLNTCQDEFEGASEAREELSNISDPTEREEAERRVKKRVLGNMRLISELYKQDMVKDWIMVTCIVELLSARATKSAKTAPEDNIEAVLEIIKLSGAKLSKSDKQETLKKLDKVMRELERLMTDKANGITTRVRLAIKDVMELKRANWVPRREAYTAKKLDEVRAQAEAELGMISSSIAASLPQLPGAIPRYGEPMGLGPGGLAGMGAGARDDAALGLIPPLRSEADVALFPAFRGDSGADRGFSRGSALLGDYKPPPIRVQLPMQRQEQVPVVVQEAPAPSRPAPAAGGKALSDEEVARKAQNLYEEFTSTLDKAEATTCVRELGPQHLAKYMQVCKQFVRKCCTVRYEPQVVEIGLDQMFNSLKEKEQDALLDLILHFHDAGAITSANAVDALTTYTTQLEDLSMDVPKAPQLLGRFYGSCVSRNIASLDLLPQLMEGDASVEPKRRFSGAAFKVLRSAKGDQGLAKMCGDVGLAAGTFLEADPEFDRDEPSLANWLKAERLAGIVPV
ncbi:eukaryotic translation initiation factor 4 [Volvox carteri f. nagariensis]|uniref:Eukaryotic translation initiation factor 4 n=1 Tax=Volvox carteri f. nagariensis TaxID=3068 RepID=D8TN78_VOLCA|nr:eukaryotic translation initiation factor 4 [Volvox carteri f. nagariensis]EFJ50942.1 eukaryotic translation initiation factor 4 [Volvox carteri f. nagariensis]|eukprot:XP_002947954.1 eukaryotic translation initiation factor 4 [Volvox carteri f. nagariensis]